MRRSSWTSLETGAWGPPAGGAAGGGGSDWPPPTQQEETMSQPAQQQEVPGIQSKMTPVPDCGEESYQGTGQLRGKVAVITGADSGIGRAVAIAYAREG